jgi:hypothetical protein
LHCIKSVNVQDEEQKEDEGDAGKSRFMSGSNNKTENVLLQINLVERRNNIFENHKRYSMLYKGKL